MTTLWSGRFDAEPDPDLLAFGASFRFDRRLFEDDVRGSIAWAEALEGAGVLTGAEREKIAVALTSLLERAAKDPTFVEGNDEDVHSFVERQLIAVTGNVGRKLHTGRSRNEQVSLDLRLYLKRRSAVAQRAVVRLVAVLMDQAESAGDTVMPSYTHLRRAQPVMLSHFFLAHAAALRRDHGRLEHARRAADVLPLGSGAIVGTAVNVDTAALAAALGLSGVVPNSLDASGDRDFVADFLYAAAMTLLHLSRLAEDVILFSAEEFGFFELSDAASTGSSLMPQKKNPDPLELIRGKAGRAVGRLTGLLTTIKGLPSGYNKDLQEDKEAVFDAEDTLVACLAAAERVMSTLMVNAARAREAASGLLLATDVADYLVDRGVPFRTAHEIVGGIVLALVREGRDFSALSPAEWKKFSDVFDDDIVRRLSPAASVAARRTPQSTGPAAVAAALEATRLWVRDHQ